MHLPVLFLFVFFNIVLVRKKHVFVLRIYLGFRLCHAIVFKAEFPLQTTINLQREEI